MTLKWPNDTKMTKWHSNGQKRSPNEVQTGLRDFFLREPPLRPPGWILKGKILFPNKFPPGVEGALEVLSKKVHFVWTSFGLSGHLSVIWSLCHFSVIWVYKVQTKSRQFCGTFFERTASAPTGSTPQIWRFFETQLQRIFWSGWLGMNCRNMIWATFRHRSLNFQS